jgi:hypothetical protein
MDQAQETPCSRDSLTPFAKRRTHESTDKMPPLNIQLFTSTDWSLILVVDLNRCQWPIL